MTSLAITLSVDARGPSGMYIISDSRITWGNSNHRWDGGQKTFSSKKFSDIFGYCGDAYFPPMILRQLIEQLDAGLICEEVAGAEDRHKEVLAALKYAMIDIVGTPPMLGFTIFHGSREGEGLSSIFHLWKLHFDSASSSWTDEKIPLDAGQSYFAKVDGSGANSVRETYEYWQNSPFGGTSRAAIWAFCDALSSGKDKFSGGPPQLVGLWRIDAGKTFGFFWHGKAYLAGLLVTNTIKSSNINWFNHLFERCSLHTGSRIRSAQKHVKPRIKPLENKH